MCVTPRSHQMRRKFFRIQSQWEDIEIEAEPEPFVKGQTLSLA